MGYLRLQVHVEVKTKTTDHDFLNSSRQPNRWKGSRGLATGVCRLITCTSMVWSSAASGEAMDRSLPSPLPKFLLGPHRVALATRLGPSRPISVQIPSKALKPTGQTTRLQCNSLMRPSSSNGARNQFTHLSQPLQRVSATNSITYGHDGTIQHP